MSGADLLQARRRANVSISLTRSRDPLNCLVKEFPDTLTFTASHNIEYDADERVTSINTRDTRTNKGHG